MKSICAKEKHNFGEGEDCAMGPSEASVHCSTGEQTGKVLKTQWCSAPLTVFKSHPRSESSPDPGSAHSTCGEDNKLPKQTNTNFEVFTTCQGGL